MRRLFVLLPSEESCRAVVRELQEAGIPEGRLHVIAGLTHQLKDLPKAAIWQRTQLVHGIEWGLGLGGVAGLLGGMLAVSFPPAGLVLGGGALMAWSAAGAGVGAIISALLGSQEHHHDLDKFQRAIAAGQLLLMIDVPRHQEEDVRSRILQHHREAKVGATPLSPSVHSESEKSV